MYSYSFSHKAGQDKPSIFILAAETMPFAMHIAPPTNFTSTNMAKLLLKTPNPFSALLMIFLFSPLLLKNVSSESISFSFSSFGQEELTLGYLGDARASDGVLQLTRRDGPYGSFLRPHSVGRVVYITPVHLWDKTTGKLADFTTDFSIVVNSLGHPLDRADGLSFFIIPFDADPRIPTNSSGGYLGLFSPETAFDTSKNQIVAVEFDSFHNEWDPQVEPPTGAPHVGIDINSLSSVKTVPWPINSVPDGTIGKARIKYDSNTKELSVVFDYAIKEPIQIVGVAQTIDLSSVLPEWVRIGFSAATGDKVETHELLSWSFSASI